MEFQQLVNRRIINSVHEAIIVYRTDLRYPVKNPYKVELFGIRVKPGAWKAAAEGLSIHERDRASSNSWNELCPERLPTGSSIGTP